MTQLQTRVLTYPAPRQRSWLENGKARYAPWDLNTVCEARLAGCWFIRNSHDFLDADASKAAHMPLWALIEELKQGE